MTGFLVQIGVFAAITVAVVLLVWLFGVWAERPRRRRQRWSGDGGYDGKVATETEVLKELRDSGYQG